MCSPIWYWIAEGRQGREAHTQKSGDIGKVLACRSSLGVRALTKVRGMFKAKANLSDAGAKARTRQSYTAQAYFSTTEILSSLFGKKGLLFELV